MVISAATLIGFLWGEALKKRTEQLRELQRCIYQLQNEVVFTYTPLPEAFYNVYSKADNAVGRLFNEVSRMLYANQTDNVFEAFNTVLEKKDDLYFNNEDCRLILNFSKNLGETDLEGEKKIFLLTLDNLKQHVDSAENKMEKDLKMYRALGFTLGTMIAIMLI
jgi:stage III sporulation protein AB